ncbi:MAG: AI-2E family transporter [Acetobacter sp.]|nr:AI-2E family transporter [Acetobacter sp.]
MPLPSKRKTTSNCVYNTKSNQHYQQRQQIARTFLGLCIILTAIYTLQKFLPALAWGTVFAIATWPLYIRACIKWPKAAKNSVLPLLFTAAMALIFIIPLTILTLQAIGEAQNTLHWLQHTQEFGLPLPKAINQLPFGKNTITQWWKTHLSNPKNISVLLDSLNNNGIIITRTVSTQIAHRGTLFCFSILTLFFLYKDGTSVIQQCHVASCRFFGKRGVSISRQIVDSIHGTVQGLILVGIGEGVFMGVVYMLTHAPHPALFGVITAIAAMIPFCTAIAIGTVSLLLLLQGSALAGIITFCIGLFVIFIADHFIRPALIGGTTKLPFLWVLLGIIGGAETWGLIGLFLGPAIMATLNMLWRNWTKRERTEKYDKI